MQEERRLSSRCDSDIGCDHLWPAGSRGQLGPVCLQAPYLQIWHLADGGT